MEGLGEREMGAMGSGLAVVGGGLVDLKIQQQES